MRLHEIGLVNANGQLNSDLTVNEQVHFIDYDKSLEYPRKKLKLGM